MEGVEAGCGHVLGDEGQGGAGGDTELEGDPAGLECEDVSECVEGVVAEARAEVGHGFTLVGTRKYRVTL